MAIEYKIAIAIILFIVSIALTARAFKVSSRCDEQETDVWGETY